MRISELSRRTDVPVTRIKYYIREGLLQPGERSQRNQATYGEAHIDALRLIRALRETAGLSVEAVGAVIAELKRPWAEADPISEALDKVYPLPDRKRSESEEQAYALLRKEIAEMMRGLTWTLGNEPRWNIDHLTDTMLQLREHIPPGISVETLGRFANLAWAISEACYAGFEDHVPSPGDDLVDPTRRAIMGTILIEQLISPLVRSALALRSNHIVAGIKPPPA